MKYIFLQTHFVLPPPIICLSVICLSFCASFYQSLTTCLYTYQYVTVTFSTCLSVCVCQSVSVSLCLSVCVCQSVSVSLCLSVCVCQSVSVKHKFQGSEDLFQNKVFFLLFEAKMKLSKRTFSLPTFSIMTLSITSLIATLGWAQCYAESQLIFIKTFLLIRCYG